MDTYAIVVIDDVAEYAIQYAGDAVTVCRDDVSLLSETYIQAQMAEHSLLDALAVLVRLGIGEELSDDDKAIIANING